MDFLTTLFLVGGIILLILGIFKVVKASQSVAIVGLVLLLVGGLSALNVFNFSQMGIQGQFSAAFQPQFEPSQQSDVSACSANAITSNGKSQADILIRNIENASLGYLAGTVSANSGGALIDSVSANSGASASYASMSNIPNCGAGELIVAVTTGTGLASSKRVRDVEANQIVSGYSFKDKAVHKYELLSASGDVVNIQARDSTLAARSNGNVNGSSESSYAISGTGTADGTAYYLNTSLGAKGSINFYVDVQVNGTSSVFGQYDESDGVIISYDTGTASRFSPSSLSLQIDQPSGFGLTKLSNCPSDVVNNRNVEACWIAPTMKAGVLYRIRGTLTADLGDPAPTDTAPSIFIDDKVSFRDTDGNIKYGYFSTSGTNQGVGGTQLKFVLT